MQRPVRFVSLFLLLCGAPLQAQAPSCPGPLALVLSGGGAKGMAHVGVLRVLGELGIRPDLVVGTSMGAIVGAMYASGYTADQIEQRAQAVDLVRLFRASDRRAPRSLGEGRPLLVWEQGIAGVRTAEAAAREASVNAALNRALLRGNLQARGDFDSLPIPFRAIATARATRAEVALRDGDLAQAVRASIAIPLVFPAEHIHDLALIDGGLSANVPIGAARRAGALRVIVSDVGQRTTDSTTSDDALAVAALLTDYLFIQPLDSLGPGDHLIRPAADSFANLDFSRSRLSALVRLGEEAARAAFDSVPGCTGLGTRAAAPEPPRYRLARLGLEGLRPRDGEVLRRLLRLRDGEPIDLDALREGLGALGESDQFRELWLRPTGSRDSLDLALAARLAPPRFAAAGVAYDNDLGGQVWLGGVDRGATIPGIETATTLVLGELRQELSLAFRPVAVGRNLLRPVLSGQLAREKVRQFTLPGGAVLPVITTEVLGELGLEQEFGGEWLVTAVGLLHAWHAPGSSERHAAGGQLRLTSGPRYRASWLELDASTTTTYSRVALQGRQVIRLGRSRLRLIPSVRAGWGTDLPLQLTFPLGGTDGFPGLEFGRIRGDRELSGKLGFTWRLAGPLDLRLEGAAGRAQYGGSLFNGREWEYGGRIGLGATTPLGPVRVDYGIARSGADGFFVRLGEWF